MAVSIRRPDDVLHEIVVVERVRELGGIGSFITSRWMLMFPTMAIADENVAVRSSASSNSSKNVLPIAVGARAVDDDDQQIEASAV